MITDHQQTGGPHGRSGVATVTGRSRREGADCLASCPVVGGRLYTRTMVTKIHRVTEEDLVARRAAILRELGLTSDELAAKVASGGLVGREWSAWSEIEDIDYLLARD